MASSEKFCLRWNDFEANISNAFRELREEKDFFDVTLACDDSQVQAHKVILSACSPFFRNVLRRNPHQHPLLYLKGVKYTELMSVLNFMYMGEANIAQEELNNFLAVAEDLRVKGLTQNNSTTAPREELDQNLSKPPPRPRVAPVQQTRPPRPPVHVPHSKIAKTSPAYQEDDIQEVVPVKTEPRDPVPVNNSPQVEHPENYQHNQNQEHQQTLAVEQHEGTVALGESYEESYEYDQYGEGYAEGSDMFVGDMATGVNKDVESVVFSKMNKVPGLPYVMWQCLECDYRSKNRHHVFYHIESKHVEHEGYNCQYCNKNCPTLGAFKKHLSRNHDLSKV